MIAKISLVLNILLIAAVAYLFTRDGGNKQDDADSALILNSDSVTTDLKPGIIVAYVLGDSINANYKYLQDKEDELIEKGQSSQNKIDREIQSAQERYMELMQKAESGGFTSQADVDLAESELAALDQKIQELQEKEGRRQADMAAETQKDFFNRVQSYLTKFSEENGIDVVLNVQQGGSVLYSKQTLDVTKQVTAGLNQEYEAELNSVKQE